MTHHWFDNENKSSRHGRGVGGVFGSDEWRALHNQAKPERDAYFGQLFAGLNLEKIMSLGSGSGNWLDAFDRILPTECEFIGVDDDVEALEEAAEFTRTWTRKTHFMLCDFSQDRNCLPKADAYVLQNVIRYIDNLPSILNHLSDKPNATVVVSQWIGWPGTSLKAANQRTRVKLVSRDSNYETLDRVFEVLASSEFGSIKHDLRNFVGSSDIDTVSAAFLEYFDQQVGFLSEHEGEELRQELAEWRLSLSCESEKCIPYCLTEYLALLK